MTLNSSNVISLGVISTIGQCDAKCTCANGVPAPSNECAVPMSKCSSCNAPVFTLQGDSCVAGSCAAGSVISNFLYDLYT